MKKILIILLFLPMMVLSQKVKTDTTVICIPYKAAKQMALDLNRLDSLTDVHNLTVTELSQTQNKVNVQDKIISTMEQKEKNYELQIEKEKEKFVIVEGQNEDLRNQVKKLKTKNGFIEIIGGALLTTLTIFSILK
jgi:exopolysaccharide biosynthesis protein